MKFAVVFAVVIATAMAAPPKSSFAKTSSTGDVQVLRNTVNIGEPLPYNFEFEQSDGQKREESAVITNAGAENEAIAVRGSFSFIGDDGQTYTVTYVADENGFQPSAPHLPVAPTV